ncbi:hypothetical protein [Gracilibacillus saliphilus]|uniref:hypothetical protein n=1 Tax=Gracilibacillus saliphilus TaxID=543890 RepID=UPI0013D0CA3B|nr:hypothetical protein [Gracilibacillus saliphilus]
MSYADILKKEWKNEKRAYIIGFVGAIVLSLYFFILRTDSLMVYFLLYVYPALLCIHPVRLPKPYAQTFWSKYADAFNFYKAKVTLRFIQLLLHMLLVTLLNQIYFQFTHSNFTFHFWNHQPFMISLMLYLYLINIGLSLKETVVLQSKIKKFFVIILQLFGVVLLGMFVSWVFDFIYYLINSTYIEIKFMRPLMFILFSIMQHHSNKNLIRNLPKSFDD